MSIPQKDLKFYAALVALALPFIWVGVNLTVRRLRTIGFPPWLAVLFFLPVVNLLFFLTFVEPIEVWDAPRLLKFSIISQPPPMSEWTPYANIRPPHLDDYLVSKAGQFLLTPLPRGRTRLEGTTWYQNWMWPAEYGRLWSDWIIHRIHIAAY